MAEVIDIFFNAVDRRVDVVVKNDARSTYIFGSESGIYSAFLNILLNSAHAMPGGGSIKINLSNTYLSQVNCEQVGFKLSPGKYIKIVITDTGEGISPDIISHIFEPCYTTKKTNEGSGLGLYTVYGNIIIHKGSISVDSTPGHGAEFSVFLPTTTVGIAKDEQPQSQNINTDGKNVLVVDDEKTICDLLSKFLKTLGYNVLTSEDGLQAVAQFKKNSDKIDLVVMDINMPKMNGSTATMEIKKLNPDCPVILITGYSEKEVIKSAYKYGASAVIEKPINFATLEKIINQVVIW